MILAKELGLSYASMALVTDYDSWREEDEGVRSSNLKEAFNIAKFSFHCSTNIHKKYLPFSFK